MPDRKLSILNSLLKVCKSFPAAKHDIHYELQLYLVIRPLKCILIMDTNSGMRIENDE